MREKEIPVYLFTGFLESGKTTFIQEVLESPTIDSQIKTLLIVLEEGFSQYNEEKFVFPNHKVIYIDNKEDFTTQLLENIDEEFQPDSVMVEYNGMWEIDILFSNIPDNWVITQEMTFFDSETFLSYNTNMRQLVYDKLKTTETIIFKKAKRDMDKEMFHKIVRGANRRCEIIYEYGPDDIELDDTVDELPFDLEAPVVEIKDRDYAIWYSDMNEDEEKYYGKIYKIKGRCLIGGGLKCDEFVIGRHIMTCCIDDIQFGGLVGKWKNASTLEHGGWAVMEAKLVFEYNKMYKGMGPVFHVINMEKCEPLEEDVATFY